MDNLVKYPVQVREYKVWNENNGIISILLAVTIICAIVVLLLLVNLEFAQKVIIFWIGLLVYFIVLLIILRPLKVREVRKNIVMSNDKPLIEQSIKPVVEEVLVESPKKKLDIPHYEYIGSMQTRTYHLRNCRLGKLVKKKYQLSNNSLEFFKKRKFRPCKICILKRRKI
jgi:uncharacterized membrane protein